MRGPDGIFSIYGAVAALYRIYDRHNPSRGAQNPRALDAHYETIRSAMLGVFQELGLAA